MIESFEELNRQMEADPGLAANMAEMGFIKRVPFQQDHNGATVSKWDWTEYGRREMMVRLETGLKYRVDTGQEKLQ